MKKGNLLHSGKYSKAAELCEKLSDRMYLYESSFMKIAKKMGSLIIHRLNLNVGRLLWKSIKNSDMMVWKNGFVKIQEANYYAQSL